MNDKDLSDKAELLAMRLDHFIANGLRSDKTITIDDLIGIILPVLKEVSTHTVRYGGEDI